MNEGYTWKMFAAVRPGEHMRLHYIGPGHSTSAGYVEQRDRDPTASRRTTFYVTSNNHTKVHNQPVPTLVDGMNIIEWLVKEKLGESK